MTKYWDIKVNFCVKGDTEHEAAVWLAEYLSAQVDMRFAPERIDEWTVFSDLKSGLSTHVS